MKTNFIAFLSRYRQIEECELINIAADLCISSDGPYIAGGAVRRTLLGEPLASDIDVFFKDEDQLAKTRELIITTLSAAKIKETAHHETYMAEIRGEKREIQLIKIGFYGDAEEVIDTFDFTITQFAYDGGDMFCGEFSLWDLGRKRLALHRLSYGVATMRRLLKYTKQGFTACAGCMQSILESVVADPSVINSDIQYVD